MRRALFLCLAWCSAGFDAATGRAVVAERPLEAMVAIPAGQFLMGASTEALKDALRICREALGARAQGGCRDEAFATEAPARMVFVSAFLIDRVEVTVAAYHHCVDAGACSPEPLLTPDQRFVAPTFPITSVTWDEASRYCAWRRARLPSEAEWERAARGSDGRTWPWGNVPRPDLSNHGRFIIAAELSALPLPLVQADDSDGFALLAPVGSYPEGASPFGVLDLAGNAMEWTADFAGEAPPQQRSTVNPRGPAVGLQRSTRGGSWRQPTLYHRITARDAASADTRSPELGFRCAREAERP